MEGLQHLWDQGDAIARLVALVLLAMSISAWVVIVWKGWILARARRGLTLGMRQFWDAPDLAAARQRLQPLDAERVLIPLVEAASSSVVAGSLAAAADAPTQLTRRLRDSLHGVLARLQSGQVLLASVGAVSPFVGLFGTVWGIYHAMMGISAEGAAGLDQVAGPVGEALIMTAAGLAVAIPAVLAYNIFGKLVSSCEADLEGFALDLRDTLLGSSHSRAARPAIDDDRDGIDRP
jgi:biopolymer transport protein ExbB